MRYDADSGKIKLGCRELVSCARRKISSALPYDEDEPTPSLASLKNIALAADGAERTKLYFGFESGEYSFELLCYPEGIKGDEIVLVREAELRRGSVNSHVRAQCEGEAYICGYALASLSGLPSVKLRIAYFDTVSEARCEWEERVGAARLKAFFDKCVRAIEVYAAPEIERVTRRLPSMKAVHFPYGSMREGQSEFIRSAYRTIAKGGSLFACAPTGTGKTVSALYPAVRALGDLRCDKVFYLTPKTTTAAAARECIELIASRGASIRAISLSAKEHACSNRHACKQGKHYCENSKCNKLSDAVVALYTLNIPVVTVKDITPIAKQFTVCPYELELAYSELSDVVICDFNYLFDPSVYIRRFFDEGGNYAFLIDEAHNLPDRAREMYSAEISEEELLLPSVSELIGEHSLVKCASADAASHFRELLYPYLKEDIRLDSGGVEQSAYHSSALPYELFSIFESLITVTEDTVTHELTAKDSERDARLQLLREYLIKLKKIYSAMTRFDSSYELFLFLEDGRIRMKIFCLDTAVALSERLSKGSSSVFFSATLVPIEYYRATLGADGSADTLEVRSPFDSSQLSVSIIDKISTRTSEREDTLAAVCRTVAATISARRGNYIVFCPSFAYLDALSKSFSQKYPKLRVIIQRRDMSAKDKADFLAEFAKPDSSYLVAFCVLGGIYSEGIDLAGDSLIGAVVVGIGMPALSYEREAMAAYYEDRFEAGKQYAYIYPGMNRVLQAAGRVIRREDDRGVIVLIDDRFQDPIYKKSAPSLWNGMKYIPDAKTLKSVLEAFWRGVDEEKRGK